MSKSHVIMTNFCFITTEGTASTLLVLSPSVHTAVWTITALMCLWVYNDWEEVPKFSHLSLNIFYFCTICSINIICSKLLQQPIITFLKNLVVSYEIRGYLWVNKNEEMTMAENRTTVGREWFSVTIMQNKI